MSRVARDAPQVEAFVGEMKRFSQTGDTLCTTPLLLNLMVSEYLRHEAKGSAIQFDGASMRVPAARSFSAVPSLVVPQPLPCDHSSPL